jgi:hypothetical protein
MIQRERNEELINRLSNTGTAADMLAPYGKAFDWKAAVNHCVILSNGEDACMVFEPKAPRFWEVTTVFGDTCRGKRALQVGREMLDHMLSKWADVLFGSVPDSMKHAQWFYSKLGGIRIPELDAGDFVYTANPGDTLFALRKY